MNEILCLEEGRVSEKGTYQQLMANNSTFATFVNSFSDEPIDQRKEDGDKDGGTGETRKGKTRCVCVKFTGRFISYVIKHALFISHQAGIVMHRPNYFHLKRC